jgi:hypothetical protein
MRYEGIAMEYEPFATEYEGIAMEYVAFAMKYERIAMRYEPFATKYERIARYYEAYAMKYERIATGYRKRQPFFCLAINCRNVASGSGEDASSSDYLNRSGSKVTVCFNH